MLLFASRDMYNLLVVHDFVKVFETLNVPVALNAMMARGMIIILQESMSPGPVRDNSSWKTCDVSAYKDLGY